MTETSRRSTSVILECSDRGQHPAHQLAVLLDYRGFPSMRYVPNVGEPGFTEADSFHLVLGQGRRQNGEMVYLSHADRACWATRANGARTLITHCTTCGQGRGRRPLREDTLGRYVDEAVRLTEGARRVVLDLSYLGA